MLACFRRDLPGAALCLQGRPGSDTHARPSRRCGPQVGGEVEGLAQRAFTTNMGVLATAPLLRRGAASCLGPFGRHLAVGADTDFHKEMGSAGGAGGQRAVETAWGVRTLRLDPRSAHPWVEAQGPACAPCPVVLLGGSWRPTAMLLCPP